MAIMYDDPQVYYMSCKVPNMYIFCRLKNMSGLIATVFEIHLFWSSLISFMSVVF